jgi:uncharacterized protein involved in response to NO
MFASDTYNSMLFLTGIFIVVYFMHIFCYSDIRIRQFNYQGVLAWLSHEMIFGYTVAVIAIPPGLPTHCPLSQE